MLDRRLTHAQIRKVCRPEDRRDFVECPCGGHLPLFGIDEFSCKGNNSRQPCTPADVAAKLWEHIDGGETYTPGPAESAKPKKTKPSESPDWKGYTVDEHCEGKRLYRRLLEYMFNAQELTRRGQRVIGWPHYDETGTKILATKIRLSSSSHDTYWEPSDPHVPFGLNNPHLENMITGTYDLIIAEGETDTATFASYGLIAIGISGSQGWLPEYAELPVVQNAARILIGEHQDQGGKNFSAKILKTVPQALVLRPPQGMNDFNDLHREHCDWEDVDDLGPHPFIQHIEIAIQAATLERALRQPKAARPKPAPMRVEAFYGLAGKIVALLEPVMETDRASILSNVLGCAGVLFQHSAHCKVLASKHYPVDYYLTVGQSAVSRKGTTTDAVLEILERTQPGFKQRSFRGLSTGQGLIANLQKHKPDDPDWDELDQDQRMEPVALAVLIEVSEFSGLLAVMRREENPLVAVMRDAWDGKPLAILTRFQPIKVGNVSLATIAHITRKELLEKLTSTDIANGSPTVLCSCGRSVLDICQRAKWTILILTKWLASFTRR